MGWGYQEPIKHTVPSGRTSAILMSIGLVAKRLPTPGGDLVAQRCKVLRLGESLGLRCPHNASCKLHPNLKGLCERAVKLHPAISESCHSPYLWGCRSAS
jgi:hypothetical protein